jgi:hypothetical protein
MKIRWVYYCYITTIAMLLSCSEKSKSVNLEDIRPKSETKEIKQKIIEKDSSELLLTSYRNDSIDLKLTRLITINKPTFLQRFPHKNSAFRTLFTNETCVQFEHELYEYVDSNQMKNAFFNWLDCNGRNCKSIKLYEETKIENANLLVIISSKSIDIIRSNSVIKPEEWINYVRFSRKISDFKYILFQKKNQKAFWLEYRDYKLFRKTKT